MTPKTPYQQALGLNDAQLKKIQEEVSIGLRTFVHKENLSIESLPTEEQFALYADIEGWEDAIAEIENNGDQYVEIRPMPSRDGFAIRERFAETMDQDPAFQQRLFKALERKKPFRNFRYEVDDSPYLQNWQDFEEAERELYVLRTLIEGKFGHGKLWELEEQISEQTATSIPAAAPDYQAVLEQAMNLSREQQFQLVSELLAQLQDSA